MSNKERKRLCLNCDRYFVGRETLCDDCVDDFELEDINEKFIGGRR